MSEKKKKDTPEKEYAAENYYDLKTEAVDKLVNAKNAPPVSEREIKKYKSGAKFVIPAAVKVLFIKFWFSGAICYFFLWGLGTYISGLDMMFALTVGLGLASDLMVNKMLHYFEPEKGAYDKWMMITSRKFWSLFLNIVYSGAVLFCVVKTYNVINTVLVGDVSTAERVAVPVEPVLFGLFYMAFDQLFVTCKNTFIKIFRDAAEKASGGK